MSSVRASATCGIALVARTPNSECSSTKRRLAACQRATAESNAHARNSRHRAPAVPGATPSGVQRFLLCRGRRQMQCKALALRHGRPHFSLRVYSMPSRSRRAMSCVPSPPRFASDGSGNWSRTQERHDLSVVRCPMLPLAMIIRAELARRTTRRLEVDTSTPQNCPSRG